MDFNYKIDSLYHENNNLYTQYSEDDLEDVVNSALDPEELEANEEKFESMKKDIGVDSI